MKAVQTALRLRKPRTGEALRRFQTANSKQGEAVAAAAATLQDVQDVQTEWDTAKPYSSIPGPRPLPIPYVGNMIRMLPMFNDWGSDMLKMQRTLYEEYGPIVRLTGMGRSDMVMLYRPEDVEKMFRNETIWPERLGLDSIKYYRSVIRKDFYEGYLGLVTSNGEDWQKFRTATNQTMMQPRNVLIYLEPVAGVVDDFIDRIRHIRHPDNDEMPEDFLCELNKFSLESIGVISLDIRFDCLRNDLGPDSEAMRMIKNTKTFMELMQKLDFGGSPWKFFPTPTWKKFVKTMDDILDITVKHTYAKWETIKKQADSEDRPNKSILETLLLRTKDPKIPIVMTTDALLAGIDTTSNAIATALYHLATNPDKQEVLFRELRRLLPSRNDSPTKETFNDLKYLRAVIKESMRLNPTSGANQRATKKKMVLSGYQIPTGIALIAAHYVMCRHEAYFKEPNKFEPERWLRSDSSSEVNSKQTNPFVFLPFGFGQRSCIGKRIAEMEIELLLCKLIRNFDIRYEYGPMTWTTRLITAPNKPLKFKMMERPE